MAGHCLDYHDIGVEIEEREKIFWQIERREIYNDLKNKYGADGDLFDMSGQVACRRFYFAILQITTLS